MSDKKYNLVIVESPAKAKTIEKYLGSDYKVVASYGHIKDLPKKSLGVNLDDGSFDLEIVPIEGKEDKIKELIKLAKDADQVFLASDPDREGEAIAYHIQETIKRKDSKRVLFNAITKQVVNHAIQNPLDLDVQKYEAQKTRRVLDRLVGYKISPILWDKLQKGLSAGRVQSVALRIIVEREEEILNFVPEKWFLITAKLKKEDIEFEAKYYGDSISKKVEVETKELADKILLETKDHKFKVIDVNKKEKKQNPTPPFTTSKLQQEGSYKLGYNSKKTMEIAQKLYEGIEISGQGRQGLITYMRTDSVRTEPQALDAVREYIKTTYGEDYLPAAAIIHTKKKNDSKAQDAHEAIRPANLSLSPEKIRKDLDYDQFRLYSLIWNKFIASQMNPAILDQTTVSFDVNKHVFKSTGSVIKFPGFRAVFMEAAEEKKSKKGGEDPENDESDKLNLPILELNEELTPLEPIKAQEKFTTPPPRFNDGSLVKELEDKGIGRPSTYAAIIQNILDRLYVEMKQKTFYPTPLGISLCKMLVENFSLQMDISFTAKMEKDLDKIEEGDEDWRVILKNFWDNLSKTIEDVKVKLPSIAREKIPLVLTGIKCLSCGEGEYAVKKGKTGDFLGCSRYPDCKSTKNFKKTKSGYEIIEDKKNFSEEKCPVCSKRMVIIKGKNGKFLSCEDYPQCKTTRPIPLDIICDKCNQGKLTEKTSKKGTKFWGCSHYPKCDKVVWNKPLKEHCVKCNHYYVTLIEFKDKETKKKKKFKLCLKCNHKNFDEDKK